MIADDAGFLVPKPRISWPDPTPEMLDDPLFNAVWGVIKTWDINVPAAYSGYCGATGNHVRAILDAVLAYHRSRTYTTEEVEAVARAICKSGKFETGQGTCAAICMDQLGEARRACPHVTDLHGKLARAALAASDAYRVQELERMTRR